MLVPVPQTSDLGIRNGSQHVPAIAQAMSPRHLALILENPEAPERLTRPRGSAGHWGRIAGVDRLIAPPLPAGCPWSGWTPPNVDWCERELCSWVVNPANTWSNLPYLALGALMFWQARGTGSRALARFGPASVAVGAFSLVYHASYTWFFQFFDFVGMFLFCFAVLTPNALRLGWIAPGRQAAFFLGGVGSASALVVLGFESGVPIQGLVALLVLVAVGQELAWRRRHGALRAHRSWWAALALFAVAAAASLLDVTRSCCDPDDHWLQGHAAWHVLSALGLYCLFRFYADLEAERPA